MDQGRTQDVALDKAYEASEVVEEAWYAADGTNVFEEDVLAQHETTTIPLHPREHFGGASVDECDQTRRNNVDTEDPTELIIHRITQMSPLDMTYDDADVREDEKDDEFYDGTGHLIWMAAVAFVHLLHFDTLQRQNDKQPTDSILLPYFGQRICELGCGTGAAGISILMLLADRVDYVLFTDNDQATLDLCHRNICANIDSEKIGQDGFDEMLLPWGKDNLKAVYHQGAGTFDTIVATDVVYDLKMINPMLETASLLLRDDGYLVLSHVPRFCLPNDDHEDKAAQAEDGSTSTTCPFRALEEHIVKLAEEHSLVLCASFKPSAILQDHLPKESSPLSAEKLAISAKQLETSHSILMTFSKIGM